MIVRVLTAALLVALATPAFALPCAEAPRSDADALEQAARCRWRYGDPDRAKEHTRALRKLGGPSADRARYLSALESLRHGKARKAIKTLSTVARRHPTWLDVAVDLGRALQQTGQRQRARPILDRLASLHDAGEVRTAADLLALGRALVLLDHPRDANDVFREATRLDPKRADVQVAWGRLLLDKHSPAEAAKAFQAALAVEKEHPDALVGLARVVFEAKGDVPGATKLLRRAFTAQPDHREALLLQARIALTFEDAKTAREATDRLLGANKSDVDALAMRAAIAFLADDERGMKRAWRKARAVDRGAARFWHIVAGFADRFHRYDHVAPLLRRALEVRPEYTPALVELGVAHSRVADDSSARVFLAKARQADPFDRRAFHMTEHLYATVLKDYETVELGDTPVLLDRKDRAILTEILGPWLTEGQAWYGKRYATTLPEPVRVEVLSEQKTFSIRAVGLPTFWAHGVCFGRVLAMRSPREGDFNVREVLLHELSHAWHIQMTGGRVPRWFTEGLAELETMRIDPTLAREIDEPMAMRHIQKRMAPICELSNAFAQARSSADLIEAYMQSRLVLEWIEARGGVDAIRAMLASFAKRADTGPALGAGLKLRCGAADKAFRSWLDTRLAAFLPPNPWLPPSLPGLEHARKMAKKRGRRSRVLGAAGLVRARQLEEAEAALDSLEPDPPPTARLVRAMLQRLREDHAGADATCDAMIAGGHGSFGVWALKALLRMQAGDPDGAVQAAEKALELRGDSKVLLRGLEEAHTRAGRPDAARGVRLRRARVDEHDGKLRMEILADAVARGASAEADAALAAVLQVRPLDGETWRLAGRGRMAAPADCPSAVEAFGRARRLGASLDVESLLDEATCLIEKGKTRQARKNLRTVRATHPDHPRLEDVTAALEAVKDR